jgi:hypothetical protein
MSKPLSAFAPELTVAILSADAGSSDADRVSPWEERHRSGLLESERLLKSVPLGRFRGPDCVRWDAKKGSRVMNSNLEKASPNSSPPNPDAHSASAKLNLE